jgi:hypothetical protein
MNQPTSDDEQLVLAAAMTEPEACTGSIRREGVEVVERIG